MRICATQMIIFTDASGATVARSNDHEGALEL